MFYIAQLFGIIALVVLIMSFQKGYFIKISNILKFTICLTVSIFKCNYWMFNEFDDNGKKFYI